MKAAVLREVGKPLQIENVQINKPGPHEVLIRTKAAGLCHSDLHFMQGSYPTALPAGLGHESAGIVEQVGDMLLRSWLPSLRGVRRGPAPGCVQAGVNSSRCSGSGGMALYLHDAYSC